jgi:hypothetical protein
VEEENLEMEMIERWNDARALGQGRRIDTMDFGRVNVGQRKRYLGASLPDGRQRAEEIRSRRTSNTVRQYVHSCMRLSLFDVDHGGCQSSQVAVSTASRMKDRDAWIRFQGFLFQNTSVTLTKTERQAPLPKSQLGADWVNPETDPLFEYRFLGDMTPA